MLTDAVLLSRPASRNEENTLLSASSSKSTDKFSGCGAKSGHLRFRYERQATLVVGLQVLTHPKLMNLCLQCTGGSPQQASNSNVDSVA